jgi:hypothetical protein
MKNLTKKDFYEKFNERGFLEKFNERRIFMKNLTKGGFNGKIHQI